LYASQVYAKENNKMSREYYDNWDCQTKMPESYKPQNGCHNCKHKFVMTEWDEPPELFCHIDNSERPLCGSVAMDETPRPFSKKQQKEWDLWAAQHYVEPWGSCEEWTKEE
jgi:hypothetical protein